MTDVLETKHLILRPLQIEDAARTQEIFPRWEIVKFLNAIVPWPYPEGGALAYYRDAALPAMERGEQWHWTLRLKESPDQHIGAIGLMKNAEDHRGFWMGLEWQGRGLMTEAAVAVTDYWFDVLGMGMLRASKAVGNAASRRISEKTGMRLVGTEMREYVSGRLPGEIWEITTEEWRRRRKREE
jgi:RimJ/RimL family protein N-acetyltransferase